MPFWQRPVGMVLPDRYRSVERYESWISTIAARNGVDSLDALIRLIIGVGNSEVGSTSEIPRRSSFLFLLGDALYSWHQPVVTRLDFGEHAPQEKECKRRRNGAVGVDDWMGNSRSARRHAYKYGSERRWGQVVTQP